MKNMLKKTTKVAIALTMIAGLSSCNDEDVINGIIIGGIIGGIVGGGDISVGTETTYTYLSDCEGYSRDWVCEWSGGSWRRTYKRDDRHDHRGPGHGGPHRPHNIADFDVLADTEAVAAQPDLKAQAIEKRWNLNRKSSVKLSQAIEAAKGGDMNAFAGIGLSLSDLNTLLNKKQVDINDLAKVAVKLQTTEKNSLAILNAFTKEYNEQKTDVNSALWGQCKGSQSWKTPEAASCSSLDAAGCSPATGATNCLPL